jgi:hypothetical protein
MIVFPDALACIFLLFSDRIEQVMPEPVIAYRPVVALDIHILLRLSRLDMFQTDAVLFCPTHQRSADVFWAIVAAYYFWLSLFEDGYDLAV